MSFDAEAWEALLAAAVGGRSGAAGGVEEDGRPRSELLQTVRRSQNSPKKLTPAARRRIEARRAITTAKHRAQRQGPALRDQVLAAMEPGAWYGAIDIAHAIGRQGSEGRRLAFRFIYELASFGFVRWVPNPDWKSNTRNVEPMKLWTLTPAGERERALVLPYVEAGERVPVSPKSGRGRVRLLDPKKSRGR